MDWSAEGFADVSACFSLGDGFADVGFEEGFALSRDGAQAYF